MELLLMSFLLTSKGEAKLMRESNLSMQVCEGQYDLLIFE